MTLRESIKKEIDELSDEAICEVRDFVLFQKYRNILASDDATYLGSIHGMIDSIQEGAQTPISECTPVSEVWSDV